ncbi:RWD domain-containing protein [Cyclospora cayetanensis]|uniref:RWD domain-containing protein n=1 Tax=Cyclospora cayetanensis TaxID=88456 RepID=A0A1D3CTC2_9EIME|nr:RWD domain-containing protein [Cyclospora cayetanensis]
MPSSQGNLQEQADEMEALSALLPHEGEFLQLSPTSCVIRMLPFGERGEGDPENRVMVKMRFSFPPEYPDTLPEWSFESWRGFQEEELNNLKKEIELDMQRNLRSPMLFSIAELAVEWLRERNAPPKSMYDQMMSRQNVGCSEEVEDAYDSEKRSEDAAGVHQSENENSVEGRRGPSEKTLCAASVRHRSRRRRSGGSACSGGEGCTRGEEGGFEGGRIAQEAVNTVERQAREVKAFARSQLLIFELPLPLRDAFVALQERCTKQEFEAWASAFQLEMQQKNIWKGLAGKGVKTGRQIFLENAAAASAAADEEGDDAEASAEAFWKDPRLFEDGDKDELPEDE